MKIQIKPSACKQTKWYEYAVRFAFGGIVTVLAGLIAKKYGPVVGGLFLAFPAIAPATMTLVESHESKKAAGQEGSRKRRAMDAAGVDAVGAMLGGLGLIAFGAVVWGLASRLAAWQVLALAALAWVVVSVLAWVIRQKM